MTLPEVETATTLSEAVGTIPSTQAVVAVQLPPAAEIVLTGAVNIQPLPAVAVAWLLVLLRPANQILAGPATEC